MTDDEAQQDRVHAYVAEIMRIVSGIPHEEAATTLTISSAALIIAWAKDKEARTDMANAYAQQLRDALDRDDIVEWIKDHTTYIEPMRAQ